MLNVNKDFYAVNVHNLLKWRFSDWHELWRESTATETIEHIEN